MKEKGLLLIVMLCFSYMSMGQSFDRSKLEFGGNLGLQFGDYTLINIAPQIGYRLTSYFTAGAGVSYTYLKDKFWSTSNQSYKYSASYFGMNVYGRFYPLQYAVISVQPEASRMWATYNYATGKERINEFVPSVLIGGGLRYGPVIAMIQYDLIQDKNSPYSNSIFYSVGYTFGF
jgi:hypothetical protein